MKDTFIRQSAAVKVSFWQYRNRGQTNTAIHHDCCCGYDC